MEAKDTVMSEIDMGNKIAEAFQTESNPRWYLASHLPCLEVIAKAQAEISFKAGKGEEQKSWTNELKQSWKQVGIKEVVEWINQNRIVRAPFGDINNHAPQIMVIAPESKWQAKLKEWSISPKE